MSSYDKFLHWLMGVANAYYLDDPNRVCNDTAELIQTLPSLSVKTDVYTWEDGQSELLLVLSGTVPATFRGQVYDFPVAVWVPRRYPFVAPIGYVTPTANMMVKPGQHIDATGKIYHPYLSYWSPDPTQASSLAGFVAVMQQVFAKAPPAVAKPMSQQPVQAQQQHSSGVSSWPPTTTQASGAPPVPPYPSRGTLNQQGPTGSRVLAETPMAAASPVQPPTLPPKPGRVGADGVHNRPVASPARPDPIPATMPTGPPPLPPKPGQIQDHHDRMAPSPAAPPPPPPQVPQKPYGLAEHTQPLPAYQSRYNYPPASSPTPELFHPQPHHMVNPSSLQYSQFQPPSLTGSPFVPPPPPPPPPPTQHPAHAASVLPALTQVPSRVADLLSFDIDLGAPKEPAVAPPPVPSNPKKGLVLQAISKVVHAHIYQSLSTSQGALEQLAGFNVALKTAKSQLEAELGQLSQLSSHAASNKADLHRAIHDARESTIAAASTPPVDIDAILVGTSVPDSQLYDVCADEATAAEARLALTRALDAGRISSGMFVKQSRSLAREEFLAKALARKIAFQLGFNGVGESIGVSAATAPIPTANQGQFANTDSLASSFYTTVATPKPSSVPLELSARSDIHRSGSSRPSSVAPSISHPAVQPYRPPSSSRHQYEDYNPSIQQDQQSDLSYGAALLDPSPSPSPLNADVTSQKVDQSVRSDIPIQPTPGRTFSPPLSSSIEISYPGPSDKPSPCMDVSTIPNSSSEEFQIINPGSDDHLTNTTDVKQSYPTKEVVEDINLGVEKSSSDFDKAVDRLSSRTDAIVLTDTTLNHPTSSLKKVSKTGPDPDDEADEDVEAFYR